MDAVNKVRDFLLDKVGHMTYPGDALFDASTQGWIVPIYCRTEHGPVKLGDVELDAQGCIVHAPCRDELLGRLRFETVLRTIPDVEAPKLDRVSQ